MTGFPFQPKKQRLEELKQLADAGKIKPFLDKVYSPYEISEAIDYILKEHPQGKVGISLDF